jgi:glycosyltransferase involved in cell wall biosynthesis
VNMSEKFEMKVAFIFMHPFSESMGSFVRLRELTLGLSKLCVDCYIFTPYEQSFDISSNVHVVSVSKFLTNSGLAKTFYKLSKLLYYSKAFPNLFSKTELQSNRVVTKLVRRLAQLILDKGIDIIQVEQDAVLPIGIALKKETNLPLIADIHNISSEELVAAGILENTSNEFFDLQDMTKNCLSETDHVVVVSECMRDYVISNYSLKSADVSVVPPGGRLGMDNSVVEKRSKPTKVVYAGLVAYREHVDLFVKSIPFVLEQASDVQFYITNKGEAIKNIKQLSSKLNVNPKFFWYDTYEMVTGFLSSCHVGVLPSSDDVARKMGTPVKLFTYMTVGLPIVANKIGGWSKIIQDEDVGLLTNNDPKDFAEAISNLLNDKKLRTEMSFRALAAIEEKYNWDKSSESLVKIYEHFV